MAFPFFFKFLPKQIMLAKTDVFDVTKKVQKGPEPPKPIFLEYQRVFLVPDGILGTRRYFGYQMIFWVPDDIFGRGSGGDSSVVWHADLSTTGSQVRIPLPLRGEINHKSMNKSDKSINKWDKSMKKVKTMSKNVQKGPKRSSGPKTDVFYRKSTNIGKSKYVG